MGTLEAIKAKLAAQKANAGLSTSQLVAQQSVQIPKSVAVAAGVPEASAAKEVAANLATPPPGLTPLQLIKWKRENGFGLGNTAPTANSGSVTGSTSSMATEVAKPTLAQQVLTPAQRALEHAKSVLQDKQDSGFYKPAKPENLPQELPADKVEKALLELDAALVLKTPELPVLLIEINRNLRQYDELAYCLTDPQLGLIVQANLTIKDSELLKVASKAKGGAKLADKTMAAIDVDDI